MPTGVLTPPSLSYWPFIHEVAVAIRSDGCSGPATNAFYPGCEEHDVQYFFGTDAREAYQLWSAARSDEIEGKGRALTVFQAMSISQTITREQADRDFKLYIRAQSRAGRWSPVAWWRYLVLAKWKRGQGAWDRRREEQTTRCVGCRRVRMFASRFCSVRCQDDWTAVRATLERYEAGRRG